MSLMTPSTVVEVGKPFVLAVVVLPWLRYAAIASPLAIPVIDGWGIDFLILLLFGLFLRTYARRAVLRTPPFLVERLRCVERLEALKARHPFLKPIFAYFLGSPGLGTSYPHMVTYLYLLVEPFTVRTGILITWLIIDLPFVFTP